MEAKNSAPIANLPVFLLGAQGSAYRRYQGLLCVSALATLRVTYGITEPVARLAQD